jgi:pimeloyl-ACP methyl ester carboxylesterase
VDALRASAVQSSRFETLLVPSGGHDPHRDDPDAVIAAMRDCLLV